MTQVSGAVASGVSYQATEGDEARAVQDDQNVEVQARRSVAIGGSGQAATIQRQRQVETNQQPAAKVSVTTSPAMSYGLPQPKVTFAGGSAQLAVQDVRQKYQNERLSSTTKEVENVKEKNKAASDERIEHMQEQRSKADEAGKSGDIGKAFGWIAAAFMAIAGAILLATGVASAVGASLLVASVAMTAALVLQETGLMDKAIDGIAQGLVALGAPPEVAQGIATAIMGAVVAVVAVAAGALAGPAAGVAVFTTLAPTLFSPENLEKMGVPKDAAGWASMGISIGLAVASLVTNVGSTIANGISKSGEAASKLAEIGVKIGTKLGLATVKEATAAATTAGSVAQSIGYVTQAAQGAATIAQGSANISAGAQTYQAGQAGARAAELKAEIVGLEQILETLTEYFSEALTELNQGFELAAEALDQDRAIDRRIAI